MYFSVNKVITMMAKWKKKEKMAIKSIEGILTKKIKAIFGVLAFVLTTNAHSTIIDLVERDYLIAGDGLITYDQSTGLEWLGLTFTQGLSMLEVEASASIWVDGWQWSTIDQMETMFDRANTYTESEYESIVAHEVVEFLGPTYTSISEEYIFIKVMGYSRNFLFDTELYEYGYDYSAAIIEGGIGLDPSDPHYPELPWSYCENGVSARCGDWRSPGWNETDSNPNYGAWLVRTSVVPIPPAVWLFGSGLIGIIGVARRKEHS